MIYIKPSILDIVSLFDETPKELERSHGEYNVQRSLDELTGNILVHYESEYDDYNSKVEAKLEIGPEVDQNGLSDCHSMYEWLKEILTPIFDKYYVEFDIGAAENLHLYYPTDDIHGQVIFMEILVELVKHFDPTKIKVV